MTRVLFRKWLSDEDISTVEAETLPIPRLGDDVRTKGNKVRRVMGVEFDYRTQPKDGVVFVVVDLDEERKS